MKHYLIAYIAWKEDRRAQPVYQLSSVASDLRLIQSFKQLAEGVKLFCCTELLSRVLPSGGS